MSTYSYTCYMQLSRNNLPMSNFDNASLLYVAALTKALLLVFPARRLRVNLSDAYQHVRIDIVHKTSSLWLQSEFHRVLTNTSQYVSARVAFE